MKTVNVRALKDKLSAYLRDVRHGEVYLVTDRGTVVAELRPPTTSPDAAGALPPGLQRMVDRGELRLGLPNSPDAYGPPVVSLPDDVIDRALAETRGDR